MGAAPNDGWFNYMPYALRPYNPGPNIDFYALANILLGISTTLGSINFIVTLLRMRAPGMSINRMPIMSWGTLTVSVGNLLAMPSRQPRLLSALDGPPVRHAFLRCPRRRPAAALAASVLDVGSSVGLRHRAAGAEHGVGGVAGLLPPSARRLHRRRARDRAHHGARLRRLAAPHVRDRPAGHGAGVLQRGLPHHRGSERGRRSSPGSQRSGPAARSSPRPSCSSPASSSCSSSAAYRDS